MKGKIYLCVYNKKEDRSSAGVFPADPSPYSPLQTQTPLSHSPKALQSLRYINNCIKTDTLIFFMCCATHPTHPQIARVSQRVGSYLKK